MNHDTPKFKCSCRQCIRTNEFCAITEKLSPEDREWMEDFYNAVLQTELDLNWHEAVSDGSWPNSVMILEGWLHKARESAAFQTGEVGNVE